MSNLEHPRGAILLEGPSASGKTTLAKRIIERFGGSYTHCTYRWGPSMFTYHQAALRRGLRLAENGLSIIDRLWPSENIYGKVYRNDYTFAHEGRVFAKLLLKHSVVGVMCLLSPEEAAARVKEHRSVGYHSPQFLTKPEEIAEQYWKLWHGDKSITAPKSYTEDIMSAGGLALQGNGFCSPHWLPYQVSSDGQDLDGFINRLIGLVEAVRDSQYEPALQFNQRNIAGHLFTAKHLIVGDQVNHADYKKCWPFSAYANSSLFLTKVFHALNTPEEELLWTNAYCEERHITSLLELKPWLNVIALGAKAERELKKLGVEYKAIPHPAWGARFSNIKTYTVLMQQALSSSLV